MIKIYSLLIIFFLSSCATTIQYVGSTHPQTRNIDVYVTESSINKPYKIIGQGFINPAFATNVNWNQVQRNSVKVGMMHGADAVLIVQRKAISTAVLDTFYHDKTFSEIFYLKYN